MNDKKIVLIIPTVILLVIISGCVTYEEGVVNGTININGSALGSDMSNYTLEIGTGSDPVSWTTLGIGLTNGGTLSVNESILAALDTSLLSDGEYTVRLTVTDLEGVTSQDLVYITVDNTADTPTLPCPAWSCDNLVEGSNSIDIKLTQQQYGSNMDCSVNCECPGNMYMGIYSAGDIEYGYDFLRLGGISHTGYWSNLDTGFDDGVNISFVSDYSVDGSSGYGGFDITNIKCAPDINSILCPTWSCDNLVEGLNSVDISVTQEEYVNNMNCSITCECPQDMYMGIYSNGSIEYYYDILHLGGITRTGYWSGFDSPFNGTVDISFTSDYSVSGSSEYGGFDISGISCTPTTVPDECELAGDYPPCGEVTLSEVVNIINLWSDGQAQLGDVIALINAWASN